MEDEDLIFITPAVRYASNWEAIPDEEFLDYVPKGMEQLPEEKCPTLKLADTATIVRDCEKPIRSIVLRNDTPGAKAKWWVLFTNDENSSAESRKAA